MCSTNRIPGKKPDEHFAELTKCQPRNAGKEALHIIGHEGNHPRTSQYDDQKHDQQFRDERQRHFIDLRRRLEDTDQQTGRQR